MRRVLRLMVAAVLLGPSLAFAAPHWEADLTWTLTPPLTQTAIRVEKKLGATGTYSALATLAATATTVTDIGPYSDGQVVCWRVVAVAAQPAIGPETCSGAPVQFPGVPGAPAINWRFIPQ